MPCVSNPYLAAFRRHCYDEPHPNPSDTHRRAACQYAWAVPTQEAIALLARYGPLIELGAGNGYWAWELRQFGVDIIAYDVEVPSVTWTDVLTGGPSCLRRYPERALLLCWPPEDALLAGESLLSYRGRHLLYVGELQEDLPRWEKPCTGDSLFHHLVHARWWVYRKLVIPRWFRCYDALYVLGRASAAQQRA